MSTVEFNGVTVYVQAIESVADGVSHKYDRLWNQYVHASMSLSLWTNGGEDLDSITERLAKLEAPKVADYPAVIVKLTSGREFRIVGKIRKEVEKEILTARRRDW